eukprot:scaffold23129_cov62-Isochrysis_galbana.AAC.2
MRWSRSSTKCWWGETRRCGSTRSKPRSMTSTGEKTHPDSYAVPFCFPARGAPSQFWIVSHLSLPPPPPHYTSPMPPSPAHHLSPRAG